MYLASGSVLGVIAIVIGLIVWKSAAPLAGVSGTSHNASAADMSRSPGSSPASRPHAERGRQGSGVSPLTATTGQPALTSGGKPEILYVGAEYCPYCAAERWAMVVALSRFGTSPI